MDNQVLAEQSRATSERKQKQSERVLCKHKQVAYFEWSFWLRQKLIDPLLCQRQQNQTQLLPRRNLI